MCFYPGFFYMLYTSAILIRLFNPDNHRVPMNLYTPNLHPKNLLQLFFLCAAPLVQALELDVPYVETPPEIVTLMLDIVEIQADDYVIDLGTGDGRIVIAAGQRGASGLGIDIDPQRIEEAEAKALAAGVSDRIRFAEQDIFESDLGQATVVTMFLNHEVNLRMRPLLLQQLRPGTRVVSHNFEMDDWSPDRYEQALQNRNGNFYFHDIYYWVIPATISGDWQMHIDGEPYRISISQHFQKITLQLHSDTDELVVDKALLSGNNISFEGQRKSSQRQYIFIGDIKDDMMSGTVQIQTDGATNVQNWSAHRSE